MLRPSWVVAFLCLITAVAAGAQSADLTSIVERMEQAAQSNRTHYRPYMITREYRMYGSDEQTPKSEVTAEITFVPPTRKDFRITETNGSSRGEGIVRHILETESKAAATGTAPGAITRANYDFQLLGEEQVDGSDCYVLKLQPKHEDKSLIAGKAWVDKATFLIHRVEGEMAKMPSWWLKSVHVTLDFAERDGMWLQERTKAVADVRMFGKHTLTSEQVRFQAGTAEARNMGPRNKSDRSFGRADSVLGASVIHRYK